MAVHRHGVRIQQKIGSIVLQVGAKCALLISLFSGTNQWRPDLFMQPGDTLLMVTKPSFMQQHRLQEHFALISQVAL